MRNLLSIAPYLSVHRAGAILLAALLAGCAVEGLRPYERQTAGTLNYGYADAKIDALHYSVIYTDSDQERAQSNLKLRAAHLAQMAGFYNFALDVKGGAAMRKSETAFDLDQIRNANRPNSTSPIPLNNYLNPNNPVNVSLYYSAAGRITLLTPEQAQGNPNAIKIDQVLAKGVPNANT